MKRYLGDGVYADYNGQQIVLTTENGIETTNTIYLEAEVYEALVNYVKLEPEVREPLVNYVEGFSPG